MPKQTVKVEMTLEQVELLRRVVIFTQAFDDFEEVAPQVMALWTTAREAQYTQTGS